jgi:imidazolonepropionase-like amidohydrolase
LLILAVRLDAQVPAPAANQQKPVLLIGGVLNTGKGEVIQNSAVAFDQGKITFAGTLESFNLERDQFEVIDVTGKHLYPGLILPNSQLGLREVDAVRATVDQQEVGNLNPNVRALVAYNTDSDVIPTVRSNGILMSQVTPLGGLISGSSAVVHLDAWNWEDAVIKADDGIHLNWPPMIIKTGAVLDPETTILLETNAKERQQQMMDLQKIFTEAASYETGQNEWQNIKLAALKGLFNGEKILFIHANYGKEIIESVRFAQKAGVQKIVVVGGMDAGSVLDFLKENKIPVVLSDLHTLPHRIDDDIDHPFRLPFILQEAGIDFCIGYQKDLHGVRNLPFMAGTAVAYGLNKEQALSSITLNTARILGIDQVVGSVELGKDATLVVSEGDILDMRTNNVILAFIQGRQIDLNDKQKDLNVKYKIKYGLE